MGPGGPAGVLGTINRGLSPPVPVTELEGGAFFDGAWLLGLWIGERPLMVADVTLGSAPMLFLG